MTTDEQIRLALEAFAERAPAPERLRSRLHGSIRAHRQRRALLLTGAAAAATAAVGVPAAWWLRDRPVGPNPSASNVPAPSPEPTGAGNLRVPLRFRPTWLPERFAEMRRSAQVNGVGQARSWATPEAMAAFLGGADLGAVLAAGWVTLSVASSEVPAGPSTQPTYSGEPSATPGPSTPPEQSPPNATVGGLPAWLQATGHDTPAHLRWHPEPDLTATVDVSAIPGSGDVALRVAEGLVLDAVGGCETSLRFGWLPDPAGETWDIDVAGWDGSWSQTLAAWPRENIGYNPARATLFSDRAQIRDLDLDRTGDPVTLRGRPGFAGIGPGYGEAAVELEGGRWLRVFCYPEGDGAEQRHSAIRVINEMVVGPDPYLGWIGRR